MYRQVSSEASILQTNSYLKHLDDLFITLTGLDEYTSPYAKMISNQQDYAREIIKEACWKTGALSGTLSLPPGPFGILSLLPELLLTFKLQGKLVKDIASIYGKESECKKEILLYCLFNDLNKEILKDVIQEVGWKVVVRPVSLKMYQNILEKLGLASLRVVAKKTSGRWVPLLGAIFSGGMTYLETKHVGERAMKIFSGEIIIENGETKEIFEVK